MKNVLLTILTTVIAFLIGLLNTYIILSIANLYKIDFITKYSFVQVFGIIILIHFITMKFSKMSFYPENSHNPENVIKDNLIWTAISIVGWGISFLLYYIIS